MFLMMSSSANPFLTTVNARIAGRKYDTWKACYVDEKWFCIEEESGTCWVVDKDDERQWTGRKAHPTKLMSFGSISPYGVPPLVEIKGNLDSSA